MATTSEELAAGNSEGPDKPLLALVPLDKSMDWEEEEDDAVEDWTDDEEDKDCTTAEDVRIGLKEDLQGIPWARLQYTRKEYRDTRFKKYEDYMNVEEEVLKNQAALRRESKQVVMDGQYYGFCRNLQNVRSTIEHFQLRNLLWATSKHDVYLVHDACIKHWNDVARKSTKVLDLSGGALEERANGREARLGHVKISTSCVRGNLVAAGGFNGELAVANLEAGPGVAFSTHVTYAENAITNGIEIFEAPSGSLRVMTSNNDMWLRIFDTETFLCCSRHSFPWPVNYASMQPGGAALAVVGDHPDALLLDARSGQEMATLHGHLDYSFAVAWHPSRPLLATGNQQDTTTRVWDMRMLRKSVALLRGSMGAVRSLRFSPCGCFLAAAESVDFVHLYDVDADFGRCQEIDMFGELGGMAFSPDSEALFVSLSDVVYSEVSYSSLVQFRKSSALSALGRPEAVVV